ncbi:alpha/beta fold hydrolase [Aquirhabdus parva]|uniref:Alpha/beta hydrolase n=1 Tax=Aquirhabdus parva TaxID=2283318 RepID=A0A345P561_9GAMM|nr:alpha/beta hydrolase [Aquirhabdus parva]AXI02420.1 alpha/beta hydrolase [Aquirhabdus parva]
MNNWSKPQVDSRFALVDGLRIHYKLAGDGPAVMLLHGSASSLQGFEQVAALLAKSFTVIRPDLSGFGLTGPRPDGDYRIETYVSTLARFMDALQIKKYSVVGNSLGGNVAWNMALEHPERLNGIVLINATGYPEKSLPSGMRLARNPLLRPLLRLWLPRRATERNLKSIVGSTSTIVNGEMVDRVHGLMSLPGNRSAFIDFVNTDQKDRSKEIHKILVPTLVLRSARVDGQHFSSDIINHQELIHNDGGHLLPEEDPVWVAGAVEKFLQSLADPKQQLVGAKS